MLTEARLVAAKDLRIERRARVASNQVLPFAVLVLVLFAFALDPDRGVLDRVTPGLYWVAVLLSTVLAVQRAYALEAGDGVPDALRLSGLDPTAVFLGKTAALVVQMLLLEAGLLVGVAVLYSTELAEPLLLAATCLAATIGLCAAGSLYGVLAAGLRVRETLLPLLLLPVLAPVLIGATRAFEYALAGTPGEGWPWCGLLAVFAAIYTAFGMLAFGSLLEEL